MIGRLRWLLGYWPRYWRAKRSLLWRASPNGWAPGVVKDAEIRKQARDRARVR